MRRQTLRGIRFFSSGGLYYLNTEVRPGFSVEYQVSRGEWEYNFNSDHLEVGITREAFGIKLRDCVNSEESSISLTEILSNPIIFNQQSGVLDTSLINPIRFNEEPHRASNYHYPPYQQSNLATRSNSIVRW